MAGTGKNAKRKKHALQKSKGRTPFDLDTPLNSPRRGAYGGHDHSFRQTSQYVMLTCIVKYYRYDVMFNAIRHTPYAIRNTQYAIDNTGRNDDQRPYGKPLFSGSPLEGISGVGGVFFDVRPFDF